MEYSRDGHLCAHQPDTGTISTFNLLVMKSFFAGLPEELEEAAAIDGLDTYRIFVKIILPLSKPIIATMCLFYIVTMWNEWFTPMLYLDSKDKWPIALYVRQLVEGANNTEVGSSADASSVQATLKSATMVLTSPLSEQAANDPMTIIDNMYIESCLMMVEGYLGLFQVNGSAVTLFPFVDSGFHFQCLHIISCRFVWLGNVQRNRMGIAFLGIQLFTCIL